MGRFWYNLFSVYGLSVRLSNKPALPILAELLTKICEIFRPFLAVFSKCSIGAVCGLWLDRMRLNNVNLQNKQAPEKGAWSKALIMESLGAIG